jgi:hypothetical protein
MTPFYSRNAPTQVHTTSQEDHHPQDGIELAWPDVASAVLVNVI